MPPRFGTLPNIGLITSWIIAATGSHTASLAVLRHPQGARPPSDPGGLAWATTKAIPPVCAMLPAPRPAFRLRINPQNYIYCSSVFRTGTLLEHAAQVTCHRSFPLCTMASCTSAGAGAQASKNKIEILFSCSLRTLHTWHLLHTGDQFDSHGGHRGIQNTFPLTPIFLSRFPQPCFPQPCFPRTCLLHQLFPQSTSLSLLPSTLLHAFPYHLSLNTSQPANLFALLNLREFTRLSIVSPLLRYGT